MEDGHDKWAAFADTVARLAGKLGLSEVQVRWRLLRLRDSMRESADGLQRRATEARYEHWSCPRCGRLNDGAVARCHECGGRRTSRLGRAFGRLGLRLPGEIGGTALVGASLVIVHARIMLFSESPSLFGGPSTALLLAHGANYGPLSLGAEPWRLATAIFLHGGLLHLFFNLMALSQVGPLVEEQFGRSMFFVLFLGSGLVASLGSALLSPPVPSIGASGAVMGLIGVVAGWGHRRGGAGRAVRNHMLKWAAYVGLFGVLVPGIDNAAHATGFVAGGLLGLLVDPSGRGAWRAPAGALAALGCLAAALAALHGW